SWMTFNWIRVKGPPFPRNPILLAGTWKMYSKRAMPQLIRMMEISPNLLNHFHSWNFKWPYQASTIKELLRINSPMVRSAFMESRELNVWTLLYFIGPKLGFFMARCTSCGTLFSAVFPDGILSVHLAPRFFPVVHLGAYKGYPGGQEVSGQAGNKDGNQVPEARQGGQQNGGAHGGARHTGVHRGHTADHRQGQVGRGEQLMDDQAQG